VILSIEFLGLLTELDSVDIAILSSLPDTMQEITAAQNDS